MADPSTRTEPAGVPPRPSLLRSAFTTYGAYVTVAAGSFLSVLITARVLGADGRGSVALLTTIGFLTAQLATLGLYQAAANFAARDPHLSRPIAGTCLALTALFGTVAAAGVAVLAIVAPAAVGDPEPGVIALVLAVIPALVLQPCLDQLLRAHYSFAVCNLAWISVVSVNLLLNGALALAGALTVTTAVGSWAAGQLTGTAILALAVLRRLDGFGRLDRALARRMLGFGLKAYAGRIMLLGNYRLDQWLLGAIAGPRELGAYSVAVAWVETLFILPTTLTLVQRPDLVRASTPDAERQAAVVFRAATIVTVAMAIALVALAPFLCVTLFGEEFRDSIEMLRLLAFGVLGIVALKLLGNALTAQRRPLLETAAIAAAFAATVILDLILIPAYGGSGAAIASTVAYLIGGTLVAAIFVRALGGRPGDLVPRGGEIALVLQRLRVELAARRAAAGP